MSSDDRRCYRGASFTLPFKLEQRSDGAGLAISTWQFSCDLRANDDDDVVLATTTVGGHWQISTEDGPEGRVKFKLTAAQTEDLPLGEVGGDVYRTDGTDAPIRLFYFRFPVRDRT